LSSDLRRRGRRGSSVECGYGSGIDRGLCGSGIVVLARGKFVGTFDVLGSRGNDNTDTRFRKGTF